MNSVAVTRCSGQTNSWNNYGFVNEGDNVSVTATFSEAVNVASGNPTITLVVGSDNRTATYASGDNSTQQVFQYTIQAGDNDSNGISILANALDNNSSMISDRAGNIATDITHDAVSDNSSYIVDNTPPTVSSVAIASEPSGEDAAGNRVQYNFLNANDVVEVKVTFSETPISAVIVDNPSAATLTLVVGSDNRTATYHSGSSTIVDGSDNASLVFRYTIQATNTSGENDDDGISIGADALNSNTITIRDAAGNIATDLTHSAVDNNSSYKVDTTPPSVDNFTMSDTEIKIGDNATVDLVFSEAICVVSGTNRCATVFTAAAISHPSGDLPTMSSNQANDNKTIWAGTFTPTVNTEDDNNTLSLATTYTDLAGNNGPDNQTANYEVDTLAPTVSVAITSAAGILTYTSPDSGFVNAGDNVSVTATFSERVIVESGTPTIPLVVGSNTRTATYTSGDNSTALVFRYMIKAGDNDSDGISILGDTLALNSSTIKDAALNNADLTHDPWLDQYAFIVDNTLPIVNSVAITNVVGAQNSFVNAGDRVYVTATFSEAFPSAVIVDNPSAATLTLVVGSDNRTAAYDEGDNTATSGSNARLVFRYTIQATGTSGENDSNGISIGADALNSNIITISDRAGNIATDLTHDALSDNSSYKVDTTPPSVTDFEMDDIEIKTDETATVTLVFSEPICAVSSECAIVFSAADISHPSGDLPTMSSNQANDNKTIWTGTFTPTVNTEDDSNRLELSTSYTDLAGNNGPDNQTANYEVDTNLPSATFAISDRFLRLTDNATVTLTFSEPVVGFSNDDITIPNLDQGPGQGRVSGTLSTMISIDNITWTGTFMPTFPNTEDWTNRLVLSDNYTDIGNNTGSAATSQNYMVDDIDPSTNGVPTLTLDDTLLTIDDTAELTVVFPEPVDNFSNANITVPNLDNGTTSGSLGTMNKRSDNVTWYGTFTPTDNIEDASNTLYLAASWTDTVGNPGTDNTTSNYEVDTKRPTVSSFTFSVTDNTTFTNSDGIEFPALKPGDNATVSLVFSEVVKDFSSADDITADNVDLDNMISNDNRTWTGIFTPTDNISELDNTLTLANDYTDIAGNTGTGTTSAKWSVDNVTSNYVIDTGAAAVSSFSPANNVCIPITDNITVTFNFPMDTTFITADHSTGCGASIQVSSDNFNPLSCVEMHWPGDPVASDNNTTFTLDPVNNLAYNTTYKIKVTTGAKSALGNNLSHQYVSSFITNPAPSSVSGLFMAVGSSGKILKSTDNGSSWDIANCQFATNLADVTFGNNTFVAVFDNGTIIRSTDNGSSFSIISYVEDWNGVTFGNTTFVGVGDSGRIVRSTDNASSWNDSNSGISQKLNGVTFGNNTFVAVAQSGKIVRSTDNGTSWDNATSPIATNIQGVTFGNNTFVAVGDSEKIVRSTDNGTSFDNATSTITSINLNGVTFGNNTFVAVGLSGKIMRSTDNGSNWNDSTSPITTHIQGVTFGNNTFVAVGSGGKIVRSTDNGTSFDNATSPITTDIKGVTFSE